MCTEVKKKKKMIPLKTKNSINYVKRQPTATFAKQSPNINTIMI